MIVSASFRTDIPAFYADWLLARLKAGFCLVKNPYSRREVRVDLGEGVDAFVFWTKNFSKCFETADWLEKSSIPYYVHYSLNNYPSRIERSVVDLETSLATIKRLHARTGPQGVVWRYDPIVLTDFMDEDFHLENFKRLAASLQPYTHECVVSFMQPYRKTRRNMDQAARLGGFTWMDPGVERKRALLTKLLEVCRSQGMALSLCTQPGLLTQGLKAARCVDPDRLLSLGVLGLDGRSHGNRPGCECARSTDIGAYDTCPHGCQYCYAVQDHADVRARWRREFGKGGSLGAA